MSLLVIDVGTSSLRAAEMSNEGSLLSLTTRRVPLEMPVTGLFEFDAEALFQIVLDACAQVQASAKAGGRSIEAVGIANQRATTVVWERITSIPVGPALSWKDLRTVDQCLQLKSEGFNLAPNESATKLASLLNTASQPRAGLIGGTLDTWLVWRLTEGRYHVTDRSNAGLTGLLHPDAQDWDFETLDHLEIELDVLPDLVDSAEIVGRATALEGSPVIAAIMGDQQSSLLGQGCLTPGLAKGTFGTGAAVDIYLGAERVDSERRGAMGSYPIVGWTESGKISWGVEALDLVAGTCIRWLCDQLKLAKTPQEIEALAGECEDSGELYFVPALEGMGAPEWDFGARGAVLGLTRGTGKAQLARAVLEGIAYRGAGLVRAAEQDAKLVVKSLRVDGGMSRNQIFVQALANALGRPVEVAHEAESTVLGAGYLAGYTLGSWASWDEIAQLWQPQAVIEPNATIDHELWRDATHLSRKWDKDLSGLSFW